MNRAHSILIKHWHRPHPDALSAGEYGLGQAMRLLTIREHVQGILIPASEELQQKAEEFLDQYYPLFEEVGEYQLVQRLKGVGQAGYHSDREVGHRYPHTRFDHSKMVAAQVIASGLYLGRSFHEIALCALAAILHDIGHPAYCHDSDFLLIEMGFGDHEDRGQAALRANAGLCALLHRRGFNLEQIIAVMQEKGAKGLRQSIADTLAYVILDCSMFGIKIPEHFSWQVISSFHRAENGAIVVNDTAPLLRMLYFRALLFHQVYYSPSCRVSTGALHLVLQAAFDAGVVTPQEIAWETDAVADARLAEFIRSADSPVISSAWRLVLGGAHELHSWNISYSTAAKVDARQLDLSFVKKNEVIRVPWHDCYKKTLVVFDRQGKKQKLQSDPSKSRSADKYTFWLEWQG